MSSLWSTTWNATVPPSTSSKQNPQASTALDFLAVLATTDLKIYGSVQLGLSSFHYNRLGRGGYAVVERCGKKGHEYVAVKMCRLSTTDTIEEARNTIDGYLDKLGLEMRILSHAPLRTHPNIVNIVGICMDDDFGYSSLSLVLEYSEYGTLREFLLASEETLPEKTLLRFGAQVGHGLAALHRQLICHGDVKLENCLVFKVEGGWNIKLSDFGGSIVGSMDALSASVECSYGTRFLNAPEVRSSNTGAGFTISDAMMTDVFSFGLLIWETLKRGNRYFEEHWISGCPRQPGKDLMQYYMETMLDNGLLTKSLEYLDQRLDNPHIGQLVRQIFQGTLQDTPQARASMQTLCTILQSTLDAEVYTDLDEYRPLCVWDSPNTFFTIYYEIRDDARMISELPFDTQRRIVEGMRSLASSEIVSQTDRSHAAMCVAECYLLGFGVEHDKCMVVNWIFQSALLGSSKAQAWYYRIAATAQAEPEWSECIDRFRIVEDELARCPPQEYLLTRIRLQLQSIMTEIKSAIADSEVPSSIPSLFTCDTCDNYLPLHCAALVGDDVEVMRQLSVYSLESQCARGLTAIHYACLGGHLSTLELLIQKGASIHPVGPYGVIPLHMCLGFCPADVSRAVSILLGNGAIADAKAAMPFAWDYHDLILEGTPLEWAVRSGNRPLAQALLPLHADIASLNAAISQYFWDISEDIFRHLDKADRLSPDELHVAPQASSFGLSIAHGANLGFAMRATMKICLKYGMFTRQSDEYSTFKALAGSACAIYDFQLLEVCFDLFPPQFVKRIEEDGFTALVYAIGESKNHIIWSLTLEKIISIYTVEELECEVLFGKPYLHLAVSNGSIIAARFLLERGVNVNQTTFDEFEDTPLHICTRSMPTKKMFSLLMSFGADLNARSSLIGMTPLEERLVGKQSRFDFVESLLEDPDADIDFGTIIHGLLPIAIAAAQAANRRLYSQDALRMLLGSPRVSILINELDGQGLTLLHKAVQFLHIDTVGFLLEAEASANIPYQPKPTGPSILPLQLATGLGYRYWLHSVDDDLPQVQLRKASAMAVSFKLLQWHHARDDGHFRGITRLHLACRMNIPREVELSLAAGDSPLAQGSWPGIEQEVTPGDLLHGKFSDEDACIKTMFSDFEGPDEIYKQTLQQSLTFDLQTSLAVRTQTHEILQRAIKQS
ncbi:hypothetical protein K491DRAFT_685755 [Lophiostoma macrostomum CBS 122681]|uniref:Protein kinase domain-containing protein n=1 Tax=Lophiostoma macrostomum CBS 122681 TaxID=1314788 RepID=A0A6A6SID9_9PLEO|nr:hypothetical protein K491DRAFT_685755 [Lophiostoma macrostomum CBS 122681]